MVGVEDTVLVIGGAGFIGRAITAELATTDCKVISLDKVPMLKAPNNCETVVEDIGNIQYLENLIQKSTLVFHLAGVAEIAKGECDPQHLLHTNVTNALPIVDACARHGVRLMYASTLYVNGSSGGMYRVSKQMIEGVIEQYGKDFGLNYTVLRYGSLYGDDCQNWNSLFKIVRQVLAQLDSGQTKIELDLDPEMEREYVHVRDAAKLSLKATDDIYLQSIINIAGIQSFKLKQIAELITDIVGKSTEISYSTTGFGNDHYRRSPYRYKKECPVKLINDTYIDLGEGILQLIRKVKNYHS